jgi:hypothetical protein
MRVRACTSRDPQGLIDERMQIGDADIAIGIFWKRFGTPTGDAITHPGRVP